VIENEEGFLRESRRDWEKLGGGASRTGKDGVRAARARMEAVGGMGAVGVVRIKRVSLFGDSLFILTMKNV